MKTGIKKTIAFALTLCALSAGTIAPNAGKFTLSPTPIVAEAATQIGDFTFTRRSTNAATLTSYVGSKTSVTLPTTVTLGGAVCKVTGIDDNAFYRNGNIKSVIIPEGYTSIGYNAFQFCSNLSSVSVPSTLLAIHSNAFMGTGIKEFTIPSKVKILGSFVFNACSNLKTVKINTTIIKEIPTGLISQCPALTSVTLPSSLTKIGELAFSNCTNLRTLTIPTSVTEFGEEAFYNTPWLKNHAKTNLLVIHNNIVIDGSSAVRNVSIPSNVKGIADSAFANNRAIQQVTMPSSVTAIGTSAFKGCTNLATVTLSKNLKAIPDSCFNGCKYLRTINFPDNIETIGLSAFLNCSDLRTFRFPNKLKTIGNAAFENCKMLGEISNVNGTANYRIDGHAFENCLNLKKINGTTVVSRSGYNVNIYKQDFVKRYFSQTDNVGFIQDFVDKKAQAVVDQVKAQYPNYKPVQIARELENWMCKNGCNPFVEWDDTHIDTPYPSNLESWDDFHCESSVLMNGVGVCEGYAKGYNLLLTKAGITAEIVLSETHAWNVIKADGKWFNIDSYWDDYGNHSGYSWFMLSDKEAMTSDAHLKKQVERKSNGYKHENEIIRCNNPMGDINGDTYLDSKDATVLQNYLTTGKTSGTFITTCADMNFDGKINATDLSLLKQKILKNK